MRANSTLVALLGAAAWAAAVPATAATFDLTAGGTTTINGAIFTTSSNQSTGTGVIQSFVRVQDNGIADGYNTSGRPMFYGDTVGQSYTSNSSLNPGLQAWQKALVSYGNQQGFTVTGK